MNEIDRVKQIINDVTLEQLLELREHLKGKIRETEKLSRSHERSMEPVGYQNHEPWMDGDNI